MRLAIAPLQILDVEARDGNLEAQRLVARYAAEQVAEDAAVVPLALLSRSDEELVK